MWKALQSGLSAAVGTAEPEYGPDSIRPVGYDLKEGEKCYSALSRDDMKYQNPSYTHVETQTFYFEDDKWSGFAQVIHSNIVAIHTTAQFTFKLFEKATPDKYIWTSTKLEDFSIVDGTDFVAKDFSIVLNEDSNTYTFNSSVTPKSEVKDLKFVRVGDGIKFGKDGTTYYGTDAENPWGSMRHIFWPRCKAGGTIIIREYREPRDDEQGLILDVDPFEDRFKTSETTIELGDDTLGMYVMACQGMKPHHAAATWDFLNYQSVAHSAVVMEFTTPPSYNKTKVSVAMVVDADGKVVLGTLENTTAHLDTHTDEECGWNVPGKISYTFKGDGSECVITGTLKNLSERVDVMSEIPQFVKNIATAASGTNPYIYQFSNDMHLELKSTKTEISENGYGYSESTFISVI